MPRPCTVCTHPKRKTIDRAIVMRQQTLRSIAEGFGLNVYAIQRHRDNHLRAEAKKVIYAEAKQEQEAIESANASAVVKADRLDVIDSLTRLSARVDRLVTQAEKEGEASVALKGMAELRRQIELAARILGDLDSSSKTTVIVAEHPEWLRVRDILFRVLDRHPEAKADFIETAKELAGGRARLAH